MDSLITKLWLGWIHGEGFYCGKTMSEMDWNGTCINGEIDGEISETKCLVKWDINMVPWMSMVYPLWLADLTGVKDQTIASMCCALKYTLVGAFKPWIFMTFHEKLGMECHHPNWRTPSFFRRGRSTTNQLLSMVFCWNTLIIITNMTDMISSYSICHIGIKVPDGWSIFTEHG